MAIRRRRLLLVGVAVVVLALAGGVLVPRWLAARERAQVVKDLAYFKFRDCMIAADTPTDEDRCFALYGRDLDR